jgi:hypothetical protein
LPIPNVVSADNACALKVLLDSPDKSIAFSSKVSFLN